MVSELISKSWALDSPALDSFCNNFGLGWEFRQSQRGEKKQRMRKTRRERKSIAVLHHTQD